MSSNHVLTIKQFAAAVGFSDKTVRRKLADDQIPGAYRFGNKAGGHWKIPKDAVDQVKGKR